MKAITFVHNTFKSMRIVTLILYRGFVRDMACLISFLFIGNAYAQPLNIEVSDAQYTTCVQASGYTAYGTPVGDPSVTNISRTTTSSSPVSDGIDLFAGYGYGGIDPLDSSIASANAFEDNVATGWGIGNASATSQLCFSPVVDQTQILGIQISLDPTHPFYSISVNLLDLTSNSELWAYYYSLNTPSPNNIPWDSGTIFSGGADFNLETAFLASNQYELTICTGSNAGDDTETSQIQVTGLQVVPEPSSFWLLLQALLGLPALRRIARIATR